MSDELGGGGFVAAYGSRLSLTMQGDLPVAGQLDTSSRGPGETPGWGAGSRPSTELVGQVLGGRYELLGEIGRGGMGVVYAAKDRVGGQLCEALGYAHQQQLVHRDVKPENIWLEEDGTVKLMDFGIARLLSPSRLLTTNMALGTAYYMAPEQLRGDCHIDHRADQFALAVVLYELLTGEIPQGAIKPPRALRRNLPGPLSDAVMQGLAGSPQDRHENMSSLGRELRRQRARRSRWVRLLAAAAFLSLLGSSPLYYSPLKRYLVVALAGAEVEWAEAAKALAEAAHQEWEAFRRDSALGDGAAPDEVAAADQQFERGTQMLQEQDYVTAKAQFEQAARGFKEGLNKAQRLASAHSSWPSPRRRWPVSGKSPMPRRRC